MLYMRPPCEYVVRYILPAYRSLVARELVEKHGFSQVATAKKLRTTQASISHYLHHKRGEERIIELESIPAVQSTASKLAQNIATEKTSGSDITLSFCSLCDTLRKRGILQARAQDRE
jgi:predicted transcriptional regulator